MAIIAEEPRERRKPQKKNPETLERMSWMDEHPGEWIFWSTKNYPPTVRAIMGAKYERAYRKDEQGNWTLHVRLIDLRTKSAQ